MKALVGSLAAVALLCLFFVIRSSFAVPNDYFCDGPWNGCGSTKFCVQEDGQCLGSSDLYAAYDQIGADQTGCAPSSEESCYNDIEYAVCRYKYYVTYNVEEQTCDDLIDNCEPDLIWANVCED